MNKEAKNIFEMTNEEAQIIIGNIPVYPDDCYSVSEYQRAKAIAIEALNQRWIPVSKKLPDDSTVVFYTDNKGETGIICYWEDLPQEFEDIIAWMPLPEPYKEDAE